MVKPVSPNTTGQAHRARGAAEVDPASQDENPFAKEVADRVEDGALSGEAIKELASQVAKVETPKERALEAKRLREAIRDNPDLAPRERNQAIRELNQTLAHSPRAWSNGVHTRDSVETVEGASSEEAAPASLEAPAPTQLQSRSTLSGADPTGLLSVGVLKLGPLPPTKT